MFSPKEICQSRTQLGPFDVFLFCVWEWVFNTFNLLAKIRLFEILKMFYTRRDSVMQSPIGSIWYSCHFIAFKEGCLKLSMYLPFWNLENVYPPGSLRKQNPMGSIWYSFHFMRMLFDTFNLQTEIRRSWKSFIPRKDSTKAYPNGVHLILSFLLWSEKCVWHIQFVGGNSPFWNPKMFDPPKELCESRSLLGSIWFFLLYCGLSGYLTLSIYWRKFDVWKS